MLKIFVKSFIKRNVSFLVVAGCSLLLAVFEYKQSSFLLKYKQYLYEVTFPLKKSVHEFAQTVQNFPQKMGYITYNRRLANENKRLKLELLQLKQQKTNNLPSQQKNVLVSQVLGYEQSIFSSSMLINATDKMDVGYIVSSNDGLVGLITAIAGNVALVTTVTNKRIAVPVKTKQGLHLVLKGNNDNSMISIAIQQNYSLSTNNIKPIKVGDILYTSGEGGIFKINIPVAKVISVGQDIVAQPIVDLDKLEYVYLSSPVLIKEYSFNN